MEQDIFTKRFRQAIAEKGVSHRKMSDITGVSSSSINNFANGIYMPTMCTAVILADYLGVSLDWLFGLSDVKKPAQATHK